MNTNVEYQDYPGIVRKDVKISKFLRMNRLAPEAAGDLCERTIEEEPDVEEPLAK